MCNVKPERTSPISDDAFALLTLLYSKGFVYTVAILTLFTALLAYNPLTGVLGFEFSLFFGLISTVVLSHFALISFRKRRLYSQGPAFVGTLCRIWVASTLAVMPSLAVISLNALRIRNCNFAEGLAYFALLPTVGVIFATAIGSAFALFPARRWPILLLYILPILCIAWAIYRGLTEPPIFVYDHYFGFFPGAIYDELREITSTLVIFRLRTIALALFLIALIALLAGRGGIIGQTYAVWREAPLQIERHTLGSKLRWGRDREAAAGSMAIIILSFSMLFISHLSRSEIGYHHDALSIQKQLGGVHRTPNFIIYYDRNHVKSEQLLLMARDSEFRHSQLAQFFDYRPQRKIEIYWFHDAAQKSQLMGAAHVMIARPWAYQFYIHGYIFPHPVLMHEMAHVFSAHFGAGPLKLSVRHGIFFYPALIEGIAVAADWAREELTPHQWSRAMLDIAHAPRPEQILGPTGFFQHAAWSSYTIAGSFSRYLIDTYGIALYKKAYPHARFETVYRKSLKQLSDEWTQFLRKSISLNERERTLANYRFQRHRSIFARPCPHTIATLRHTLSKLTSVGAHHSAIQIQTQICNIEPTPHQFLQLLQLYYRSQKFHRTHTLADNLLQKYPPQTYPIIHADLRIMAALIAYRLGDNQAAVQHLNIAAKHHIDTASLRQIFALRYALTHADLSNLLVDYLDPFHNKPEQLLNLQAAALRNPKEPMLAYLLARRLHYASLYTEAYPILDTAQSGLQHPLFQAEITYIQALSLFHLQKYTEAAAKFAQLAKLSLPQGITLQALEWQQRSLWQLHHTKSQ